MGHLRYDCPQHTTNRRHYDYNDCIDKNEHTDYVQFVEDSDGDEIFTVTGGVLLSGSKDEVPSDECSEDFQRSDDEVFVDDSNVKIIMEIFAREEIEMTGIKYQTLKVEFDVRNTSLTEENRWKNEEMNSPVLPVGGFDDQLLQMELQDEAEEILSECVGWLFEEEDLCTPDVAYKSLGTAEADMELRDELYNELEVLKLMEDILRVDKRSSKCMYVQETYDNMLDVAYGGINTIEQQQESDIGIGLFLSKSDANTLNFSEKNGMNATMQLSKEQINPSGYQQGTKYSKRMDFIEKRDQDEQTELKGYTPKPSRKKRPEIQEKLFVSNTWTQVATTTMVMIAMGLTIMCGIIKGTQAYPTHTAIYNTEPDGILNFHTAFHLLKDRQKGKYDFQKEDIIRCSTLNDMQHDQDCNYETNTLQSINSEQKNTIHNQGMRIIKYYNKERLCNFIVSLNIDTCRKLRELRCGYCVCKKKNFD